MAGIDENELKNLLAKYKNEIENQTQEDVKENPEVREVSTREYTEFKNEYIPKHLSWYEKACNKTEKIIQIHPDAKKLAKLKISIEASHLDVTPVGVASFGLMAPLAVAGIGAIVSLLLLDSLFFAMVFLILGASLIGPLNGAPHFIATSWRMKASNQMVLCVFYIVTFMRHTSNLEGAIRFASDHLSPPLSLDLRRVIWNVETEKCESIKESLDAYLESWKDYNMEFVEALHLIESSLFETSEQRRVALLEKSLDVILSETYEKMLHYAHSLKGPLTMLNMLGVVLPVMGLVILPLLVSFMEGVAWYHIATLYDFFLPLGVFYLGRKILQSRPSGYGDTDISNNPDVKKYKNIVMKFGKTEYLVPPLYLSIFIGATLIFLGLTPLIIHVLTATDTPPFGWDVGIGKENDGDYPFWLIEYKESLKQVDADGNPIIHGPFGIGASLISVLIPLGLGISIGFYNKFRTQNIIKIRSAAKQLEREFSAALFQLGNRLGDGLPAEIAFQRVAETMKDSTSGRFFKLVSSNIARLGMSVEQSIFDPEHGALIHFPSNMIESSMKVLTESSKKGPLIAAEALINVSRYIKEMHKVDERLKDLMADIVGSMNSQIKFLTPAISGIVIGITAMVTTIIGKLGKNIKAIQAKTIEAGSSAAGADGLAGLFGDGMPTFHFQVIVGLYVILLVLILTTIVNGIENGSDSLNEKYLIGVNLIGASIKYSIISICVMALFQIIAGAILLKTTM
ncbi:hypothetical protein HN419_02865 [Candidatus Woesearchaeota archaeon]|jgi:hypothetical protein|nr:hypothetical protein [Candidatus Woesearchaeota archaeon]MBT3537061.1 hypothetical protein [Candidatus Woesearchaeota archaeon]MBT4697671.1 hypothetical protein [Candidatus Woesearchaeota archaeon]MBT4716981.1 hypothetical protein [Candidatus Woesearchaeota archaeon]MBT7106629.1 hypothetical protein [Candidatus Woesearchaeota archaeon]